MIFKMTGHVARHLLGIAVLVAASTGAQATIVSLSGATVNYSFDDSLLGLFGPASISGDTLSFSPTGFSAQSLNGSGIDFLGQTINILVTPKIGQQFSGLDFMEQGHYSLQGEGSLVDVGGQLRIFDPSNPLAELTPAIAADSPFSNPADNLAWQATMLADLSAYSNSASLNVTIENLLAGLSLAEVSTAQIDKGLVQLTTETKSVPEGNSLITLLIGLALMGLHLHLSSFRRIQQTI